MQLHQYLKKHRVQQKDFAAVLGVSPGLVSQWVTRFTDINPEMANKIEVLTKGQVTRLEMRPDIFLPAVQAVRRSKIPHLNTEETL